MKVLPYTVLIILLFSASQFVHAQKDTQALLPTKAIINDDDVRVREKPSNKGKYVNILYKNMMVTVLEKSDFKTEFEGESFPWFKIKTPKFKGWLYGKYVSFKVPKKAVDTYTSTGDMKWFYKRFQYSTSYYATQINTESFNTDEYRNLLTAFENGKNDTYNAYFALKYSIFKHLTEKPNDPKYLYLKKKISSQDFIFRLAKYISQSVGFTFEDESSPIPEVKDKSFLLKLLNVNGNFLSAASNNLKNNKEVVLTAVKKNGEALYFASDKLKNNKKIVQAAVTQHAWSYKYASLRLREDNSISEKAIQKDSRMLEYAINPNKKTILAAIRKSKYEVSHIPYKYTKDKDVIQAAIKSGTDPKRLQQFGEIALINDDEVRVREEPSSKGKYAGILYLNMIVKVLEESKNRLNLNGESHHWYKVKSDAFEGWIYGKYVEFFIYDKNVDTYTDRNFNPEFGMDWFYTRYGNSTNYDTSKMTAESFDLKQYRSLITGFEQGQYTMLYALKGSLYTHLKKKPDDPKYAYLKKKLYSKGFLDKTIRFGEIGHLPDSYLNDKSFVLTHIKKNGALLAHVSDKLKDDKEIALIAVKKHNSAIKHVSGRLKGDKEVVLAALQHTSDSMKYAPESLKSDKNFVLKIINTRYFSLQHIADRLKSDKDIVLASVARNGLNLKYAAETLKSDKNIVLKAILNNGIALYYAADKFKADKSYALKAVKNKGLALKYVSNKLKSDKQVVLTSINNNGQAIQYANESFRSDKRIAHKAISKNLLAYQFVSDEMKLDKNIIRLTLDNSKMNHSYTFSNKGGGTIFKLVIHEIFRLTPEKNRAKEVYNALIYKLSRHHNQKIKTNKYVYFDTFWRSLPKVLWKNEIFLLKLSEYMRKYKNCSFNNQIDVSLRKSNNFKKKILLKNSFCIIN